MIKLRVRIGSGPERLIAPIKGKRVFFSLLTCGSQESFSSKINPKYFVMLTCFIVSCPIFTPSGLDGFFF